jgi:starch synthase (maltosyl-transferring)
VIGRIVIEEIRPQVDCGRWPARAVAGETVPVRATIFRDGHTVVVAAAIHLLGPGERRSQSQRVRMVEVNHGLHRWEAAVTLPRSGMWSFTIEAWTDELATWLWGTSKKLDAGRDIELELEEGAQLLERAATRLPAGRRGPLLDAAAHLRGQGVRGAQERGASSLGDDSHGRALLPRSDPGPGEPAAAGTDQADASDQAERLAAATDAAIAELLDSYPPGDRTRSDRLEIWVDRPKALFSSWYELFPRSEGATATSGGTFKQAAERLPAVAAMGFDVLYLPPIHPIGHSHRKGRNNALEAGPYDPGSPWAIGSEAGGHDAVHPDLGTIEDFDEFVARARSHGIEVALDYALQCSPDHPWVKEHPEWFRIRPDGSIAHAENPPKVYEDIVPLNFESPAAPALYAACKAILDHWIAHGVRIYRVDNPHTKPVRFWEWLLEAVKAEHPDTIFLSEAFTSPPMMKMLAKVGFTQSYTYFTWRNTKAELEEYLTELSQSESADFMRPNLFVNTPDILHAYLQRGGPPAFKVRATLAATMSPSWGVYSGFELYERQPREPGSEEYLDSEKFQYRPRDWSQPSLAPHIARLNQIRRAHPALHWLRNLRFHLVDSPDIIAYSKRDGDDVVLVVCNLDPHGVHDSMVHLWLPALGLDWDAGAFAVHDELSGQRWTWHGPSNYVRLDPDVAPAHVFHVRPQ